MAMKRTAWLVTAAAVLVIGGGTALILKSGKTEIKFRTAKVDKGNITQRISATGTLNALIQVPVGTQVSGVVTALYADFNSLVKKNQPLAQIDPTTWQTALNDAKATLQRSEATLVNAKADYRRYKQLSEAKLVSDADLEAKEMVLKTSTAQVESSKAAVARAKIDLDHCTLLAPVDGVVVSRLVDVGQTVAASFSTPNVFTIAQDLSKMKVQAAIDEADIGQVRVGQRAFFTVDSYPDKQFQGVVSEVQLNPVINQNVVTYNVIMEVTNEARTAYVPDAGGQGKPGAAPGAPGAAGAEGHRGHRGAEAAPAANQGRGAGEPGKWAGRGRGEGKPGDKPGAKAGAAPKFADMGSSATIESTTARYIPAGSPVYKGGLALFPGMTANCTIITNRKQETLRVPSVALRFNPAAFIKEGDKKPAPAAPGAPQGGQQRQGGGGGGNGTSARGMVAKRDDRVWILENGKPKALSVKMGISDGAFTEVSGEGVNEGLVVLTGIDDPSKKVQAPGASPLAGGPGGMRR